MACTRQGALRCHTPQCRLFRESHADADAWERLRGSASLRRLPAVIGRATDRSSLRATLSSVPACAVDKGFMQWRSNSSLVGSPWQKALPQLVHESLQNVQTARAQIVASGAVSHRRSPKGAFSTAVAGTGSSKAGTEALFLQARRHFRGSSANFVSFSCKASPAQEPPKP